MAEHDMVAKWNEAERLRIIAEQRGTLIEGMEAEIERLRDELGEMEDLHHEVEAERNRFLWERDEAREAAEERDRIVDAYVNPEHKCHLTILPWLEEK